MKKRILAIALLGLFLILPQEAVQATETIVTNDQAVTFEIVNNTASTENQILPSTNEIISGLLAFWGVLLLGLLVLWFFKRRHSNANK